jgi:hypothetical protein
MVMSKLFRAAVLSAILVLTFLPTTIVVPRVCAAGIPAALKTKKKNKSKPKKTKKILKGHHGKRKGKPA